VSSYEGSLLTDDSSVQSILSEPQRSKSSATVDQPVICFSHLRWSFVHQRPQHLMRRLGRSRTIYFFEEPVPTEGPASLARATVAPGVTVVTPHLPDGLAPGDATRAKRQLLDRLCAEERIVAPLLWYYTPMSRGFSDHLESEFVVYDCMDQLAAFRGAPPDMLEQEYRLLRNADVVFTGGHSLYEAKRGTHPNVHAFPSSVDVDHFRTARGTLPEPGDQAGIPRPRIGHYAVLDERLDTGLVAAIADARPDWQLVLLGPVVKINPAELPRRANIHYLGMKTYEELPAYLSGWDVTFMPFALNEATRYISPTKTPEYLAAGRPVVSAPIADVVHDYGDLGLVKIAATPAEFVSALEAYLDRRWDRPTWLKSVDRHLEKMSWDRTWAAMEELLT
jgi:UDP-galactopyranose mutase